jgi:hypothetical protein
MSKKLTDTYYEIYGLYFEGGEERTKNIESEVAELEAENTSLKAENEAYKQFAEYVSRANVMASTYSYLNRSISEALVRLGDALFKERE